MNKIEAIENLFVVFITLVSALLVTITYTLTQYNAIDISIIMTIGMVWGQIVFGLIKKLPERNNK